MSPILHTLFSSWAMCLVCFFTRLPFQACVQRPTMTATDLSILSETTSPFDHGFISCEQQTQPQASVS